MLKQIWTSIHWKHQHDRYDRAFSRLLFHPNHTPPPPSWEKWYANSVFILFFIVLLFSSSHFAFTHLISFCCQPDFLTLAVWSYCWLFSVYFCDEVFGRVSIQCQWKLSSLSSTLHWSYILLSWECCQNKFNHINCI